MDCDVVVSGHSEARRCLLAEPACCRPTFCFRDYGWCGHFGSCCSEVPGSYWHWKQWFIKV